MDIEKGENMEKGKIYDIKIYIRYLKGKRERNNPLERDRVHNIIFS